MADEGIMALFLQVGPGRFAVESDQVETLRRKETLYPAPGGPPDLLGFLPLGEEAVPVLDLGRRLGLETTGGRRRGLLLMPPREVSPLSFRVDDIEGPLFLSWKQIALLPRWLREIQSRPMVWGLVWQEDVLVPLLDLSQIVLPEENSVLLGLAAPLCS